MERVTVDFDSESYYLDGKYWESWDDYGEEMADAINNLLDNEKEKVIASLNLFYQAYISIYGLTHSEKVLLNHFVNELLNKIVLGDDND